ncbi:MAG TPA: hypothetical protein DCG12_17550 [Planctomycetaceae bacterium]|nr:hypothetical protein [Planctomycetaceae bacterium]
MQQTMSTAAVMNVIAMPRESSSSSSSSVDFGCGGRLASVSIPQAGHRTNSPSRFPDGENSCVQISHSTLIMLLHWL